jgi:hypothetical protein
MKTFLAIYTCSENSKNHQAWKQLDPETQQARMQNGMLARQEWAAKYKNQIIFEGASLSDTTKVVNSQGVHDIPSQMGAFVVVQANSHDEAAKMFVDHPHFNMFPGDGVEILELSDNSRC